VVIPREDQKRWSRASEVSRITRVLAINLAGSVVRWLVPMLVVGPHTCRWPSDYIVHVIRGSAVRAVGLDRLET
jgi:hypothetical protein